MRPFTDFGDHSIVIPRSVSWSPDSRYVYAGVAETDADIVLLHGCGDVSITGTSGTRAEPAGGIAGGRLKTGRGHDRKRRWQRSVTPRPSQA
jgi:hypothetical protein